MSSLLLSVASGGVFGAALTASGVYSPSVIIEQLQLQNWHMIKTFLAASACSAFVVYGSRRAQYAKLPARRDASYGWFMPYDANIVGGLLQGVGMALTKACPGTVLVQLALGFSSAWTVALGCALGGIVFVKLGPHLRRPNPERPSESQTTVHGKLGMSATSTVLAYEILCLAMIVAAVFAPTRNHWLNPVIGGLSIGVAQASSVLLTRSTLGVSGAWEDIGKIFWGIFDGTPSPTLNNLVFAGGIIAGAKLISHHIPDIVETDAATSSTAALIGGVVSIFGARIAGGCASGHGISGMATMGLSSFITVASMFGAAIATALILR